MRTRCLLLLILALLISSCGRNLENPFDPGNGDAGEAYFAYAMERYREMDYVTARESFSDATKAQPDFAEAYAGAAWCDLLMGDTIMAIAGFRTALQVNPSLPDALLGLSSAMLAQGDYAGASDKAKQLIETAESQTIVTLFVDDPLRRAYLIDAECNFHLGRYSDAVDAIAKLGSSLIYDPTDDRFAEKFMSELSLLSKEVESGESG